MPAREHAQLRYRSAVHGQQNRWSLFVRGWLVLPHLVITIFLIPIFVALALTSWIAVIVLGTNPLQTVTVGLIRYVTRVSAYKQLLTDRFAPFSTRSDDQYPVDISIDGGGYNRLRAALRPLLIIPFVVLALLVTCGVAATKPVTWALAVTRGHLNRSVHEATSALSRFSIRIVAFITLAQDEFPRGLYGDQRFRHRAHGERREDDEIELPQGMNVVSAWSADEDEDAHVTTLSVARWDISLSMTARRVLSFVLALGFLIPVVIVLALVVSITPVSAQSWSNSNWTKVSSIEKSIASQYAAFHVSQPRQLGLTNACATVEAAVDRAGSVPPYPSLGPNDLLQLNLHDIIVAANECQSISDHHGNVAKLEIIRRFDSGYQGLTVFLGEIPNPVTSRP